MGRVFFIGFWPESSFALVLFPASLIGVMQQSIPNKSLFQQHGSKVILPLNTTEEAKGCKDFQAIGPSWTEKPFRLLARHCRHNFKHGSVFSMSLVALGGVVCVKSRKPQSRNSQQKKAHILLA